MKHRETSMLVDSMIAGSRRPLQDVYQVFCGLSSQTSSIMFELALEGWGLPIPWP